MRKLKIYMCLGGIDIFHRSVNMFLYFVFTKLGALNVYIWSVRVAERLALPTSDHGVTGSNPAGGEILPEPKRRFIAQSLSCSPFHRLGNTVEGT